MYAKLVVGNSAITALGAMRDIGRLITSGSPSTSLLSAFNTSSSVIIDSTPAGWTYIGSTTAADRPTIASTGTSNAMTADTNYNLCFSAPCLNSSVLKYATLTVSYRSVTLGNSFCLAGASAATNLGILTNEGPRVFENTADAVSNSEVQNAAILVTAGTILHVIANARHITIIEENRGMSAIWESTQTDAHTFYGIAPFVQYCHPASSVITRVALLAPAQVTTTQANSIMAAVFNITNPNTGTNYGTYDPTEGLLWNIGSLAQTLAGVRTNTITSTGAPRYVINPVFYSLSTKGFPTQYVTGIVPVYWTAPSIGSSGDSVDVNGDTYTWFNAGAGFGIILKTG